MEDLFTMAMGKSAAESAPLAERDARAHAR